MRSHAASHSVHPATRGFSGCKLIYIFKHSIMIFHRHKMFIVPLLRCCYCFYCCSLIYGTVKAKSSSTFQSNLFIRKFYFY